MIMDTLWVISTITTVIILNCKLCVSGCTSTDYKMNGQCCPKCPPGSRVYWHCSEDASTTCIPCPASTYMDKHNQLAKCLPCTVCKGNQTLKTKQACNKSSDTVCGPLEGYYCINQNQKGSCRLAVKHSTCSPGQYINQTGTEFSDTVCVDCPAGSYSDGTLCKLHTKCESLVKITVKEGTKISDAECNNGASFLSKFAALLTFVGLVTVGLVTFVGLTCLCLVKRYVVLYCMQYGVVSQVTPPLV